MAQVMKHCHLEEMELHGGKLQNCKGEVNDILHQHTASLLEVRGHSLLPGFYLVPPLSWCHPTPDNCPNIKNNNHGLKLVVLLLNISCLYCFKRAKRRCIPLKRSISRNYLI